MTRPEPIRPARDIVLVVDDDRAFNAGLANGLRRHGLKVGQCFTGDEAIAAVVGMRPALVLLDLDLPDQSGIEVVMRLRAAAHAVPIVLMSGYDDWMSKAQFAHLDVLRVVHKPMPIASVARFVQAILAAVGATGSGAAAGLTAR